MTRSSPLSVPAVDSPGVSEAPSPRAHPGGVVEIRTLRTIEECEACVALQRHVWGFEPGDVVPVTLLHVVDYVGGLAAGAFDASGQLLGFVFGVSGVRTLNQVYHSPFGKLGMVLDYAPPEKLMQEIREEHGRVDAMAKKAGLVK